jgi:uncharacterized protein YneF (UPF0154 family)
MKILFWYPIFHILITIVVLISALIAVLVLIIGLAIDYFVKRRKMKC